MDNRFISVRWTDKGYYYNKINETERGNIQMQSPLRNNQLVLVKWQKKLYNAEIMNLHPPVEPKQSKSIAFKIIFHTL